MNDGEHADPRLIAKARHLGTTFGTQVADFFPIRDAEHAKAILLILDAEEMNVSFHPRVEAGDYERMFADLHISDQHEHAETLRLTYADAANTAAHRVLRLRGTMTVNNGTPPHGYHKVQVILTATSNPLLTDEVPIAGELEVFATTEDHRPIPGQMVFREKLSYGPLGKPCEVDDVAVTYQTQPDHAEKEAQRP